METNEASYADDVWAVGCIVVRLALGGPFQPWWDPNDRQRLTIDQVRMCHLMTHEPFHPHIPTQLSPFAKQFVKRCFTRNPQKRPTAAALSKDPWFMSGSAGMERIEDYRAARYNSNDQQSGYEEQSTMMERGFAAQSAKCEQFTTCTLAST